MPDLDLTFVDETVGRLGRRAEAVIPILQAIQGHYRYLPREALQRVCQLTDIRPAAIEGVATFYTQFRHRPVGEHVVHVCHGTACHVKGSERVQDALERHLGIAPGQDTDPHGRFTIAKVACLGCCTLAPVVQIDGCTYGRLTSSRIPEMIDDFLKQGGGEESFSGRACPPRETNTGVGEVRIGLGSCCVAQGSGKVHEAIGRALQASGAAAVVKRVGCVGMCHQTPLVELVPAGGGPSRLFARVQADEARAIVFSQFRPRGIARRVGYRLTRWLDRLLTDEVPDPAVSRAIDPGEKQLCAFLGPQRRVATEDCGQVDPTDLDEYLRHDGFQALRHCIEKLSPEEIVAEVKRSGLRGRGGAGFPTGLKWATVRAAPGQKKYIICNGDEGDPGAFMDRMLLESFPYRVIEGLAIAARAVGADEGIFYIRAEYPLAVKRIHEALRRCEDRGLLGDRVLSTDFRLHLSVKEGAGAFVCGEETALLASLEGRRGMPRLRPPYPAESGLWGKPTSVNNVETYALVPWIFRRGAAAFAALGTEKSKGTKVFALAGKVARGGLIEVPMGITIGQIVEAIGGGVAGGRRFKAVQVGGPSGGCVPAGLAQTPVDYEALAAVGAIMGSGGMVVLDDQDCMVDMARYFLQFTQDQSCGKCTLCRIGTRRMLDILDRITTGQGRGGDLENLEQLARTITAGSICGLGRTAPNPVLSTLRYFRDEYEAHLAGRCPAGRCKALITYRVTDDCIGCTLCAQQCPADAIPMTPYAIHAIDPQKCTRCDTCRQICPVKAVVVQ
ncbi:MAG: NADH-quinone oxidoreductase subunit NuoE [Thermoguttaceae bacterium]|jgi:NADH-quinone oxidoreductase subunit F